MHTRAVYLVVEPADIAPVRREITETLTANGGEPGLVHDIALLATELMANALIHGGTEARVTVLTGGLARIEVHDGGPGVPVVRPLAPNVVGGNGMLMVDALAQRWGVDPDERGGKCVWMESQYR